MRSALRDFAMPGGKHEDCHLFVLDLTHDRHAREALAEFKEAKL